MTTVELKLETIEEWAYEDHKLVSGTDYKKGFKAGFELAQQQVRAMCRDSWKPDMKKKGVLEEIVKATRNRYSEMPDFQRPELSKEELFECAEELRHILDDIVKLATFEDD